MPVQHSIPDLFQTLSSADWTLLSSEVRTQHHAIGDVIFSQGEASENLHWVVSGSVKAVRYRPDGKEVLIHRIHPGELFAEVPSLLGTPFPVSAIAEAASEVASLHIGKLKILIAQRPELALNLMAALAGKMRSLVSTIEERTALSTTARIAARLLELSDGHWVDNVASFELLQTKLSLAQECGTVSEVLSRAFHQWKTIGILEVNRSRLVMKNQYRWQRISRDLPVNQSCL